MLEQNLHVEKTQLDGVLIIRPPTRFFDFRGEYTEIYNRDLFKSAGIEVEFIQDDISISGKHVLRGIHGDSKTWKLVSCLRGSFYLVVLDYRSGSSSFGAWQSFNMNDSERMLVLIPPGFGNGHLVMSDSAIFHYKQNTNYDRSGQFTVRWDDPRFNIWWPIGAPITSQRDG